MDLQNISSIEKVDNVIEEIIKNENRDLYFLEAAKLYLKSLILYIRSEKATEDDLFEEIHKITLLPINMQESILTQKRQKDYYAVFDKFLGSAIARTRSDVMNFVTEIINKKIENQRGGYIEGVK